MKLCMNEITIMQHGDIFSHIADCAEAGYPCIEFRKAAMFEAMRRGHTLEEIAAALRAHNMELSCINSVESISFNSKRALRVLKESAEYLFYCSRQLGCDCVEVIASFGAPTEDVSEINRETAEVLTQFSDLARPYGVKLAIEYMGLPKSSVTTFRQSLDIVNLVGRDNVGILLDTWHHYAYGSTPEDVLLARGDQIFVVHVSDCPERAVGTAVRSESYLPGQGVVPIGEILRNVRKIGYDGMVSVEIFDPAVQAMDAHACLAACRDATLPLLAD